MAGLLVSTLQLLVVGLRLLWLSAAAPTWLRRRLLPLLAVAGFGLLAEGLRLLLAGLQRRLLLILTADPQPSS